MLWINWINPLGAILYLVLLVSLNVQPLFPQGELAPAYSVSQSALIKILVCIFVYLFLKPRR